MVCSRCGAATEGTPSYCPNCGAPMGVVAVPGAVGPAGAVAPGAAPLPGYGGFWRRFGAAFIDSLLLQIVSFPTTIIAMIPMGARMESLSGEDMGPAEFAALFGTYMTLGCLGLVIGWLYFALLESSALRATVGKMACGIVVTDVAGARISFARASGRFFASMLSSMTFGVGYIVMFFNERRQNLHDLVAGTLVLRKA